MPSLAQFQLNIILETQRETIRKDLMITTGLSAPHAPHFLFSRLRTGTFILLPVLLVMTLSIETGDGSEFKVAGLETILN